MARSAVRSTTPILVATPVTRRRRGSGGGRLARRNNAQLRRGTTYAAAAAREEAHTIAAVLTSAVMGYASRPAADGGPSMLSTLPHITAIGPEGTLGALAWALGRFMKSKIASHVATGALSVAAYKLASNVEEST